jgi:23S rRNA pseudouridine1911/1915/1917 synthase
MPANQNSAAPMTIKAWLQQQFPTAKGVTLKRMVQDGRVLVNGTSARSLKQEIGSTDKPALQNATADTEQHPPQDLRIVYEDGDLLVVSKPAGLLTSTIAEEKRSTLLAMVRSYVAARQPTATVGLIHRLDRSASGLLIFSKNANAYESLKRQFFEHTVQRRYIAVVQGLPRQSKGRLESYLIELPTGEIVCRQKPGKGRLAITDYVVLKTVDTRHGPRAMLQVTLQTGRKHQIRTHLKHLGTPIVNDPIYSQVRPTGRMMLTAVLLGITHPRTRQPIKWEIPIPREIKHAMTASESA